METKKINLELSLSELEIVFNCLIGEYSCPPESTDFVNRVYQLCRANGIKFKLKAYC